MQNDIAYFKCHRKYHIDQSGNNLLVSASPKKINEIREIVNEVDVPTTQIMLEADLLRLP